MLTIQEVMNTLTIPVQKLDDTVDVLMPNALSNQEVKGIVVTFMASHYVLQRAKELGANLVITHEGTFYSHHNHTEFLKDNPVFQEKCRLIEESGLAIYRFHDYWHRYQPDGIMTGLIQDLEWESYLMESKPTSAVFSIPPLTVRELGVYVKNKLDIPFVRVAGNLSMTCSRVGVLAGYRGGGEAAIPLFMEENVDVILAGEGPEWETPEFVRDAVYQGRDKAFILLGHAASEKPGMRYLADLITGMYPHIPVYPIAEDQPFQII